VIEVSLFTWKLAALCLPNATDSAPVKLHPLIVTGVPPPEGPRSGLIAVTAGVLPGSTSKDAEAEIVPGSPVVFGSVTVTVWFPTTPQGTVNAPPSFGGVKGPGMIFFLTVMLYVAALTAAVVDPE
jgi:hypothetical protein